MREYEHQPVHTKPCVVEQLADLLPGELTAAEPETIVEHLLGSEPDSEGLTWQCQREEGTSQKEGSPGQAKVHQRLGTVGGRSGHDDLSATLVVSRQTLQSGTTEHHHYHIGEQDVEQDVKFMEYEWRGDKLAERHAAYAGLVVAAYGQAQVNVDNQRQDDQRNDHRLGLQRGAWGLSSTSVVILGQYAPADQTVITVHGQHCHQPDRHEITCIAEQINHLAPAWETGQRGINIRQPNQTKGNKEDGVT